MNYIVNFEKNNIHCYSLVLFSGHFYLKDFEQFILNNNFCGGLKSQRRTAGFITRQRRIFTFEKDFVNLTVTGEIVCRNF